jgi:hypothetical protein
VIAAGDDIAGARDSTATPRSPVDRVVASPVFTPLKWTSFAHSCIYTALLVCAFAIGKPEPATTVLGYTHGLLWIVMSLACIACTRLRIVPLRLAVAVAVLGGIGPFFGSCEFVREQRRRDRHERWLRLGETDRPAFEAPTRHARVSVDGGGRDD